MATRVETSYGPGARRLGLLTWAELRALDTTGLRAGDTAEVSDLNYGAFVWTGTLWRPRSPVLLPVTTTIASLTGTVTETNMATATAPAGAMGTTGALRITVAGSAAANNANAKNLRLKFGGTTYQTIALASVLSGQGMSVIRNLTAASQKAFGGSVGTSTTAAVTSAVNTGVDVPILVTGQLGVTTDTMTLDGVTIELLP